MPYRLVAEAVEINAEIRTALEGGALEFDMEIAAMRLQSILLTDGYRPEEYAAVARELRFNRLSRPIQPFIPKNGTHARPNANRA